jgi:hypothetical protein
MSTVFVDGIGLFATGLANWSMAQAVLRGEQRYEATAHPMPAPEWLPPAERRRTSDIIRLAMCAGREALENAQQVPNGTYTVFSSSGGSGEVIHQICEVLAQPEREVSPTRFHNSVHNAPAGYWGIGSRSEFSSTSLCGHDHSFSAGLLEAVAQVAEGGLNGAPVLLLVHDLSYPEPLNGVRSVQGQFSVALLLSTSATPMSVAQLDVSFSHNAELTRMRHDAALESFRLGNPAARALPLLAALARGANDRVTIEGANGSQAVIDIRMVSAG